MRSKRIFVALDQTSDSEAPLQTYLDLISTIGPLVGGFKVRLHHLQKPALIHAILTQNLHLLIDLRRRNALHTLHEYLDIIQSYASLGCSNVFTTFPLPGLVETIGVASSVYQQSGIIPIGVGKPVYQSTLHKTKQHNSPMQSPTDRYTTGIAEGLKYGLNHFLTSGLEALYLHSYFQLRREH